jgi:hypothetical protein
MHLAADQDDRLSIQQELAVPEAERMLRRLRESLQDAWNDKKGCEGERVHHVPPAGGCPAGDTPPTAGEAYSNISAQ